MNKESIAEKAILAEVDLGNLSREELFTRGHELVKERFAAAATSGA